MEQLQLETKATSVFEKIQTELSKKGIKILVLRGGTRSSKTYSTMQHLVLRLLNGTLGDFPIPEGVCTIVRKHKVTLKSTAMRDLKEIMDDWNVTKYIWENKTDRIFTCGKRCIEFMGADDYQKIKGSKRAILYCNEWNELNYKLEFFQLNIRTKYKVIIDFNPDDEDIWINKELEQKRQYVKKDVSVIVSTYKDNKFLSKEEVEEIENIKEVDPVLWQVYGEGQYGKMTGRIYNNWEVVDWIPEGAEYLCHGLDFWFSSHPAVLVWLYRYNGDLYLDEEFYNTGKTNKQMSDNWKENGVKGNIEIYADSAEPKSIAELRDYDWNVKPVKKGADSVDYGIQLLKTVKIKITARSVNWISEAKKYKWKVDKNGEPTNEPIKEYDHFWDAVRYGAIMKLNGWKRFVLVNLSEIEDEDDED